MPNRTSSTPITTSARMADSLLGPRSGARETPRAPARGYGSKGHAGKSRAHDGLRWAADGLLPPEQAPHRPVPGGAAEAALLPRPRPQDAGASHAGAAAGLRGAGGCLAVTTAPGDR